MDMSVIVGVVLGLAVAYWVISTACSFIVEALSSTINVRGRALSRFVAQMVGTEVRRFFGPKPDGAGIGIREWLISKVRVNRPKVRRDRLQTFIARSSTAAGEIATRLLTHPIIEALDKPQLGRRGANDDASYIPAEQFARALFDVLIKMPTPGTLENAINKSGLPPGLIAAMQAARVAATPAPPNAPPTVEVLLTSLRTATRGWLQRVAPASEIQQNLEDIGKLGIEVRSATTQGGLPAEGRVNALAMHVVSLLVNPDAPPMSYAAVRDALKNNLLPRALVAAVSPLIEDATHDLDEARKSVERWYDGTMERASGWYKRYSMVWLGITGLIVAGLFGLDSIKLGEDLIKNSEHRAAAERLARRINENPDEARAWVQRTVVTAGVGSNGILTSKEEPATNPFEDKHAKTKLLWELQATASAFGEGKFAAATILATNADFNEDYSRVTWTEISLQVDRARECDASATTRPAKCALTSFQQALEADPKPDPVPDIALAYWSDPRLVDSANIKIARQMHEMLGDRTLDSLKKFRAELKTLAQPFPWFVSSDVDWPLEQLSFKKRFWGLCDFLREFFAGFIGKVITALMVALGAPYWYEIIGKVVNVRGTGSKPTP